MSRITDVKKQTDNRFLNMYDLKVTYRNGGQGSYYVASRSETIEGLTAVDHELRPAGVMLFGLWTAMSTSFPQASSKRANPSWTRQSVKPLKRLVSPLSRWNPESSPGRFT